MKKDSVVQSAPFTGRKRSLIEDARRERERERERESTSASPGPSPSGDNFVFEEKSGKVTLSVLFALKNEKNAGFFKAGKVFETFETKLLHLESRPCRRSKNSLSSDDLEFFMKCEVHSSDIDFLINSLKRVAEDVRIVQEEKVPWFPRKISDLDKCNHLITKYDPDLDQDHPGFSDLEYRKRRAQISELAFNYKHGDPLPCVEYTAEEITTWREVFKTLTDIYPTHACRQFLEGLQQLEKECGYGADKIPQLREVSAFLKEKTGFELRPVAGLLSARDFLASLAFRVFQCTQYIRHSSAPMHSPEPDCCHELLGHIPMLTDKEFAQFSQEIGLASLGASDEDIEKLSTVILHRFRKRDPDIPSIHQSLLTSSVSIGELHSYSEILFFLQTVFAKNKCVLVSHRQYSSTIQKPFTIRYDPYTCSMEVLDSPSQIHSVLGQIREELKILHCALERLTQS
uniref:Tyrosine hydroxylase 2 n=1 Tax=Astyanax mexicanus TaxID=7994 RepID=A0A8B9HPZ5_ASTMX